MPAVASCAKALASFLATSFVSCVVCWWSLLYNCALKHSAVELLSSEAAVITLAVTLGCSGSENDSYW